jgi:hypothetical protein
MHAVMGKFGKRRAVRSAALTPLRAFEQLEKSRECIPSMRMSSGEINKA